MSELKPGGVNEPKTLLLTETGVELMPDGSSAVNVGPIVRALRFLTEGRGEDRGTDEHGHPLPDLMSLAFDVVEAIILGGRKADYFRQVKRELEAQTESAGHRSLALAKQARRVHAPAPTTALDQAAATLEGLLAELSTRPPDASSAQELAQALESFRGFGVDRWVSATAQLFVAVSNGAAWRGTPLAPPARAARKPKKMRKMPRGERAASSAEPNVEPALRAKSSRKPKLSAPAPRVASSRKVKASEPAVRAVSSRKIKASEPAVRAVSSRKVKASEPAVRAARSSKARAGKRRAGRKR